MHPAAPHAPDCVHCGEMNVIPWGSEDDWDRSQRLEASEEIGD